MPPPSEPAVARPAAAACDYGDLPEWNLADLYPGMDAPELKTDLARADSDSIAFESRYKGKLGEIAAGAGRRQASRRGGRAFEALEELLGRIISYAGLLHAGDTSDPDALQVLRRRAGEDHRRQRASSLLRARTQPASTTPCSRRRWRDPALGHYRPWLEDIRKEKPYQLEDRVEQLFHEKSVTGRGAWNRLFDETMTSLRFTVDGEELAIEPTLNLLQDADETKRHAGGRGARRDVQGEPPPLHAHHQYARQGQGDLRPLARLQGRRRRAPSLQPGRAGGGRCAGRGRARRLSAPVAPLLRAEGALVRPRPASTIGTATRRCPRCRARTIRFDEARATVLGAYGLFAPDMADIARRFFDKRWIDAPVRPGKAPGAFAHPTVPSAHPYVLLNYQGKVRDVMTLAHELGHGVHQVLAAPQGALMAPTPLTLAETASVFGEMLTFRALLGRRPTTAASARRCSPPRSRT